MTCKTSETLHIFDQKQKQGKKEKTHKEKEREKKRQQVRYTKDPEESLMVRRQGSFACVSLESIPKYHDREDSPVEKQRRLCC